MGERPRGRRPRARAGRTDGRPGRVLLRGGVRPRRDPDASSPRRCRRPGTTRSSTLGFLAGQTTNVRLITNVFVGRVPPPADDGEGVRDARHALGRPGDPRHRRRARRGGVRRARDPVRRPRAAPRRRHRRHQGGMGERVRAERRHVGRHDPAPVQQPRPPIWIGGSKNPALRRVAASGRRLDPAGHAHASSCPSRSRTCAAPRQGPAGCRARDRRDHRAHPPRDARLGRCPRARSPGRPSRWPSRSTSSARWACRTCRWASCRARSTSCVTRWSGSATEVGPLLTRWSRHRPRPRGTPDGDARAPVRPADARLGARLARRAVRGASRAVPVGATSSGFDVVVISEHHGIEDGCLPAPVTMAAAIAGRTAADHDQHRCDPRAAARPGAPCRAARGGSTSPAAGG